ncbi:MAG: hypothetical protein WAX14_14355 [Rhodococcus sp. (in: high G+C Gram-positive bacteria)]|uniref:hypothetical protein n=1 Tax=Rhodococcus sp. TaxID=1831 RepID=UPI003BB4BFBD
MRRVVAETGIVRGRGKRAVDSTILADAVATQDTITQLIAAIRRVGRQVPGAAEQITAVCTGHDYTRQGKPRIDWDDPDAKDILVSTPGQRRERVARGARRGRRRRVGRADAGGVGVAGVGRRAGRRTRRRHRRHRRSVAHRP